ncbi:unnamed protein product [Symbiodinium pilosum]|uniref:Endonuclease/exonuclease/phosphatase domain-containing protein n=1 Tax=Symbiodinium pilosum TaxID=2952 RepID=A0A812X6H9_SYMPI|nr:unnamed protein product [Symbiodinium pilosum]
MKVLDSRRLAVSREDEEQEGSLLHRRTSLHAEVPPPKEVTFWTYRSAALATVLLSVATLCAVGFHVRGLRHGKHRSSYERLYKFGDPADLAHYKESVSGICSKSSEKDHLKVIPITEPSVRPRGSICKSASLQRDFPCKFTKTWSCPSFGTVAQAKGIATDDSSAAFHCCCNVDRPRQVTWSRRPFAQDDDAPPAPQTVRIKVVTYNLYWWNLFGIHKGNGGTAGGVIATTMVHEPVDLIAFQECRDKDRVLRDAGLLHSFKTFGAKYDKCIALRKEAWIWIQQGEEDVAADVYWNNFGPRGVVWVRLWHKASGLRVFFANHHGPLAVNSGGTCGGHRTARNILKVIDENSEDGDIVILVGDFNANSASHTIQELRRSLVHVQAGRVLGGIDSTFTNLVPSTVAEVHDLGSGGSDHHAMSAIFEINTGDYRQPNELHQEPRYSEEILSGLRKEFPEDDWNHFWCGLQLADASYNPVGKHAGWVVDWKPVPTPDWCCKWCQRNQTCIAFRFEGIPGNNHTKCTLMSAYELGPKDYGPHAPLRSFGSGCRNGSGEFGDVQNAELRSEQKQYAAAGFTKCELACDGVCSQAGEWLGPAAMALANEQPRFAAAGAAFAAQALQKADVVTLRLSLLESEQGDTSYAEVAQLVAASASGGFDSSGTATVVFLLRFKRLTAEEREELEDMKTSRFEREEERRDEHKAGSGADGDNGPAMPLPGFLTSVPGVSSVASSSYVLSAYEYAKENPMMTAWTVGTAAFSAAASAFRTVYEYFYPPQDAGWLGGWDGGLLSGGAAVSAKFLFVCLALPVFFQQLVWRLRVVGLALVELQALRPQLLQPGVLPPVAGLVGYLEEALTVSVVVLILLLSESLVLFIVTLSVSGFLFASMKFCLRPWAWLGMDSHMPILFDLQTSGLEVGTWDYCFLRRKSWPATTLRDLRVYKEAVDSLGESGDSEPVPISSSEKVSAELPHCCDATKACFGSCWRSCCSTGSGGFLVAGVFLGAKVDSKVVRLTRDVWTLKEVDSLLMLAQRGRQLLGLPEQAPLDLESADVQVVDVECIACVMGKEEGLPTIREDTILRDSTEPSVLPMFSKETSEVADERCAPTVRSGVLAPRPKMKSQSQAKVQDLLAV